MAKAPVQRGFLFHVLDVVFNIVVIVAIVAAIRTFLVSPFQVEGHSMDTTLADGEYIVINKLAYIVGEPRRGDVVVLRPPNEPNKFYVKRVIGVPGDRIDIRGGEVYVTPAGSEESVKLDEPYLDEINAGNTYPEVQNRGNASRARYDVPEGEYFVLGDNRMNSTDSRSFAMDGEKHPYVPEASIKGRVWFVALPITKIHAFSAQEYALEEAMEGQK